MNAHSHTFQVPRSAGDWVDRLGLTGPDHDHVLHIGVPVARATLRRHVAEAAEVLHDAGLRAGGTAALRLPPSLGFVAVLLAAWRLGAQVSLLDHRLTPAEIGRALDRLAPQVLVEPSQPSNTAMRGYAEVTPRATARPGGRRAETGHVLIQLSSGSTGPSKVIARTAADLEAELDRYAVLDGFPRRGGRTVLLSSMVHVLGLVGGLLHGLHAGVELVLPERLTAASILAAVAGFPESGHGSGDRAPGTPPVRQGAEDGPPVPVPPTTLIGVPFYAELLAAVPEPPPLPMLARMIVAGELTRPGVPEAFRARFGVPLGSMYGMTELGVIATDLDGTLRPELAVTAGLQVRVADGELQIRRPDNPYLGLSDPARWADGWLRTRDAAVVDAAAGRVTILGRLDSQVSIGGLKVDLTEVEQTVHAAPGVTGAVVVFDDGAIRGYVTLAGGAGLEELRGHLTRELAAYKLPRRLDVLAELPRTATGKVLRDAAALREAARGAVAAGAETDRTAVTTGA